MGKVDEVDEVDEIDEVDESLGSVHTGRIGGFKVRWTQFALARFLVIVAFCLCACNDGGGSDGGPDSGNDGSTPEALPASLEQIVAFGSGNLRTEQAYSYSLIFDLRSRPYAVSTRFSEGSADIQVCEGQGQISPEQSGTLDDLLDALRICRIEPGGVEFCDLHQVRFHPTYGSDEGAVYVLREDTGCSLTEHALCSGRDELYELLRAAVIVDQPDQCPEGYLDYMTR